MGSLNTEVSKKANGASADPGSRSAQWAEVYVQDTDSLVPHTAWPVYGAQPVPDRAHGAEARQLQGAPTTMGFHLGEVLQVLPRLGNRVLRILKPTV